jgi:hypothetical protein
MVRQLAAGTFLAVFIGFACWIGNPQIAQAGPVEELAQLAVHPSDPDRMVLRFEYSGDGLLYTSDGGETFSFVCGSSVADPANDLAPLQKLGPIGMAGDGSLMIGVFAGLWSDDGKGCGWSREDSLADRWVTDIVPHPGDPEVSFLITSNGGEVENGVIRRNADGTFTELGEKKAQLVNRLRVVERPEGGLRFYTSVVLGQIPVENEQGQMTTKPNYAIRFSDDEGETWTEHELGVLDGTMRLEGVDPSNPDRIVINIGRDEDGIVVPDSVMVSENRGESFAEWTTVSAFGGITFSSEGEVWIGDAGDTSAPDSPRGIKHAASLADEAEVLADGFPVRCLHYTGDSLFTCQRFAFGTVSLEDGEFTPAIEFSKIETMAQCDGVDTAAVCRQQLCSGYCGTGHFAAAPMCQEVYESTEEIGCASLNPGGMAGTGGVVSGGAGGESGAGGAGEGGAGESGEGGTSGGGDGDGDGDQDMAGDGDDDSGGCSSSTVGKASRRESALGLAGLLLLMTFLRRRRMS